MRTSNNFTYFSFPCIIMEDGKKRPIAMPNWRKITKDNKQHYSNENHHGKAIITGELSSITVFDFHIASSYYEMVEKFPDLKKVKTIKTNKGFHLYFEHDLIILTTVDAFNDYVGIDICDGKSIIKV